MSNSDSATPHPSSSFLTNAPWRKWPLYCAAAGGLVALIGLFANAPQFRYSYLMAFMFFLSIMLGSLILIILFHLFDSGWSTPIRRVLEQMACLAPYLGILFIPIALYAGHMFEWMKMEAAGNLDHALHAKHAFLNRPFFYIRAVIYFSIWTWLAFSFRKFSLAQDKDGAAVHTRKMRVYSGFGIWLFALTTTGAAVDWMKSLMYEWFSTMYGVWYFAASVWVALGTLYGLTYLLSQGPLKPFVRHKLFHNIGVLMFAFTVFHAYISFSQYLIIWSGAIPEETFWYVLREQGSWRFIGYTLIFGHFLVPFLMLLRIDVKVNGLMMMVICVWFWMMHFIDISYNISPALNKSGFVLSWIDIGCMLLLGGLLAHVLFRNLARHPVYPLKDPRLHESIPHHEEEAHSVASSQPAK